MALIAIDVNVNIELNTRSTCTSAPDITNNQAYKLYIATTFVEHAKPSHAIIYT